MQCRNCGKEFNPLRKTQQYCSRACQLRKPCATIAQQPIAQAPAQRLPANFGQPDCPCQHCQQLRTNKSKYVLNHGEYKPADELGPDELNRVGLPCDADYIGAALPFAREAQQ